MLTDRTAWVAIMTHPNAEGLVANRFETATPPIEYYLPKLICKDKRFKHNMQPEKAMFPGYLFAHINKKQVYQTRTTKGVMRIVSTQHSIIEVPDREIEAVRMFEASQRKVHFHESSLLVRGAKATILEGEFAGMEGTLVKNCKDGNFCVNIEVMNISIVVRVKRNELRPSCESNVEAEKTDSQ